MAEARSFTDNVFASKQGVDLSVNDDGLHLSFSLTIPPPQYIHRSICRCIRRRWMKFWNEFFPLGPVIVMMVVAVIVSCTLRASHDSWIRSGRIATFLWDWTLFLPWSSVSNDMHIAILATFAGLLLGFFLAVWNRFLVRLLLLYKGWLYESPGCKKSLPTKAWGFVLKLLSGRQPSLFSWQSSLPKLPVPALKDTIERYLTSVKPLSDDEDMIALHQLADNFITHEGLTLQRYLVFKSFFSSNYVTDWWEKYVYLRGRSPLLINSNYYGLDTRQPPPGVGQAARAANITWRFMKFKHQIDNEEPFNLKADIPPVCMSQYERMFSTTRIPGRECDKIVHRDPDAKIEVIAVLCRGHWYSVRLYHSNGKLLTPWQLELQFDAIIDAALHAMPASEAEASLSALPAMDRTRWASTREAYFSTGINKISLDAIENSVFIVSLDMASPNVDDYNMQGKLLFHGNGSDRWCDKSLNLIVFSNGCAGINCEHSWADAPIVAHLFEATVLSADFHGPQYQSDGHNEGYPLSKTAISFGLVPPTHLRWSLSRECELIISEARKESEIMVADLDLEVVQHTTYGKDIMKKMRISPDGFVQMAMQLAYYSLYGKLDLTYESSMTRLYLKGRTETVRPVSNDSLAFILAMNSPDATRDECVQLLRKAVDTHILNSKMCMCGEGVDRHLFALYVVSVGRGIESPFLQKVIGSSWMLSTSQQPQHQTLYWDPSNNLEHFKRHSCGGGFGPVSEAGYGISYMVLEHAIYFHITSKVHSKTSSKQMGNAILQSLRLLQELLE